MQLDDLEIPATPACRGALEVATERRAPGRRARQRGHRWLRTFGPVERRLEPLLAQPLAKPFDGPGPAREGLGDPGVGPVRTVRIGLEQGLGPANLPARAVHFPTTAKASARSSEVSRTIDFFRMAHLRVPESSTIPPSFLAVTEH